MTVNSRSPRARSPRGALALAAATATVLGTTALTLPAYAAAPAGAGTGSASDAGRPAAGAAAVPLTDGTLDWGIKKSFRDYITGPIANGKITVADGAEKNADGTFRFTDGEGSYDTDTHAVSTAFHGSVHLYGHQGALDIELSDFKVTTEGTDGFLSADVATGTGEDGTGEPEDLKQDVDLAALDLTDVEPGTGEDGAMTFADIPATLTADGSTAFAGYYKEGEKLDPATLNVTASSGGSDGAGGTGGSTGGSGSTAGSGSGTAGTSGSGGSGGGDTGGSAGDGTDSGDAEPAAGTIADGNLDWGVKKSFRDYVTGPIANGTVKLSDGATSHSAGYRFPDGSGTAGSGSLNASFQGGVRFLGHKEGGSYSLDLTFSHLKVKADGTKGTLVSDVRSKDRESGKVTTHKALTVANLTLEAGALDPVKDVVTVKKAPATLTAQGAEAFGGFYKAGEKLDPVTAAVSLDENASLPGAGSGGGSASGSSGGTGDGGASAGGAGSVGGTGGGGALASSGSNVPSGALLGGAALLAALGAGAVCTAHRRTRSAGDTASSTSNGSAAYGS
ncbi:Htaa protein [Streptomyces sp. Amel2xB2]|uniref:HtaA domain-containing protein n=1 Tax=Streptomyces sp. Amel2xB2 TaxID=1305829 RepID=UPI000DBA9CA8|nr:HtaA domain-containing protein [Streptomyces sp. Amel2xB2]RAJ68816.1 Htaa protein [Streptomyces sp. Amel2xB2]